MGIVLIRIGRAQIVSTGVYVKPGKKDRGCEKEFCNHCRVKECKKEWIKSSLAVWRQLDGEHSMRKLGELQSFLKVKLFSQMR